MTNVKATGKLLRRQTDEVEVPAIDKTHALSVCLVIFVVAGTVVCGC